MLRVIWEVVSPATHVTEISDDALVHCTTEEEQNAVIDAVVRREFKKKVGYGIVAIQDEHGFVR